MNLNEFQEGKLLLINKPVGWTSFDVVKKLRYALQVKKIGHAGTLDPLATGLLLIGVGKFTKKLNELQGLDKSYSGIIEIGKTTPSYDLETEFDSEQDYAHITMEDISNVQTSLTGAISQVPPAHSAIKVNGERAYKKARKNQEVKLQPREVVISDFEVEAQLPELHFSLSCTKGTYIRSLAHDFGKALGVGGYLKKLVRTRVGDYLLEDAYELDAFLEEVKAAREG